MSVVDHAGQPKSNRSAELDGDVAEVGLGIHGEAGMKKVPPRSILFTPAACYLGLAQICVTLAGVL